MSNMIDLNDLITTEQAATILGLKRNTLEIWRHQGKGPPFLKVGNGLKAHVRYHRATLSEWLGQQTFKSTSENTAAVRARPTFTVAPSAIPRPWEGTTRNSSQPRDASE